MKKTYLHQSLWCLVNVLRLLLAATFIFSGVTKLIDPHGTEYKILDYATSLGMRQWMPGLLPLILAILLAAFEFVLGVRLLFGIRRRQTTWLMLLFMLLMTPLTLYIYLTDMVVDCGCFGEALVLTNGETFVKNLFLLSSVVLLMRKYRLMTQFFMPRTQWIVSLYAWIFSFCFAAANLYALPMIDFRPYRLGTNLLQALETRSDAQYETRFLMEKEGKKQWFTLDNYPDTTWKFVDSEEKLISGSDEVSAIQDFSMELVETGEEITIPFLAEEGYKFLLVMPYLETADDGVMDHLMALYDYCKAYGYPLYALTSSDEESISHWSELTGAEYPFCHTDALALKTMIRSNPGLVLLHGGEVVGKWSSRMLPAESQLQAPIEECAWAKQSALNGVWSFIHVAMWFLIPLLMMETVDRIWWWRRHKRAEKRSKVLS